MKKILILGGGFSKERTISLDTAQCVLKVLKKKGYKSIAIEKIKNIGIGKTINDRLYRASNK